MYILNFDIDLKNVRINLSAHLDEIYFELWVEFWKKDDSQMKPLKVGINLELTTFFVVEVTDKSNNTHWTYPDLSVWNWALSQSGFSPWTLFSLICEMIGEKI